MTDIKIDDDIATEIAKRVNNTKFESVEAYVNFVLVEIINKSRDDDRNKNDKDRDLEEQLEDLGYL